MRIILPVLVSLQLHEIFSFQVYEKKNFSVDSKIVHENFENSFLGLNRRLGSGGQSECELEHCKVCSDDYQFCQVCENGYELKDAVCENKGSNSSASISLVALILITVGLSLFSFIFCSLCIYFARRYRHKYAENPNINGEHTKTASIDFETSPNDTRSPSFNQSSPQNASNREFNSNRVRMGLLKHFFKSLPSLIGEAGLGENCSFCFLTMEEKRLKVFKCKHLVHYKCCKEWIIAEQSECPQCNNTIY